MREIKFRVWDEIYKQFIPRHFYEISFQLGSHSFGRMLCDWKNYQQEEYLYEPAQRLNQFTGLKDKNGKEIYEGDILQYRIEGCVQDGYFIVDDVFQLHIETNHPDPYYRIDETLIIGNIYENPELLENEQNNIIAQLD